MSEPREDMYRLAGLLAELDRVLNPLAGGEGGEYRIEPTVPPPLPEGEAAEDVLSGPSPPSRCSSPDQIAASTVRIAAGSPVH